MSDSQEWAAGWYRSNPGQERYWNGKAWTEDYRPIAQPGNAVSVQFRLPEPPTDAISRWQLERTGWFAAGGFNLATQTEAVLTYTRRYAPTWALVVGLFTFPIGMLLWFFVRDTDTLAVRFDARNDGTMVTLTGTVKERRRREHVLGLADEYRAEAPGG